MCFYMETLPKVSQYSLEPGRQSCCILEYPNISSTAAGRLFYKDGAFTRFDRSVLPNTRDVLGKHGGT
jgi:hypothetical protein